MNSSERRIDLGLIAAILLLLAGALLLFPPIWGNGAATARVSMEESLKETPIDLNRATLEQLMTLDGIGETKASAILKYREAHGGFQSVSEAAQVKGISQTMTEKWTTEKQVICKEEFS